MTEVPAGYATIAAGGATAVCLASCAGALRDALGTARSLHTWAAQRPERRELRGRDAAYAVRLDDATNVVVRHSRHGGLLAPITRDLFVAPTRAPRELATSLALRAQGVRTPEVVAYVVYPTRLGFARADVATRLVEGGRDLAAAIADGDMRWVDATRELLSALALAGARHPDLNLKNVLLDADGKAWVLDVDVMTLGASRDEATEKNRARLERSLLKWRRLHGLDVADASLDALRQVA